MSARLALPTLPPRDQAVVKLVAGFRQLTTSQIRELLFADCSSHTPCDRALKRLCAGRYLIPVGPRGIGGPHGGASQQVYQLGRAGWKLLGRSGTYWAARAVNAHSLAVVDVLVALRQAERDSTLALLRFAREPACHRTVGDVQLTPDAYVEIGLPAQRLRYSLWLEVDQSSEHARVIRDKCARYAQAYRQWSESAFPYVLFVVPDEQRAREIRHIVATGPVDDSAIFRVVVLSKLAQDIHRNLAPTEKKGID